MAWYNEVRGDMNARKSSGSARPNPRPARKARASSTTGQKLSLKAEADRLETEGLIRLLREGRKIKGPRLTHEQMLRRLGET